MRRILPFVLLFALCVPAFAQTMDDARAAYHAGDFLTARQIADPIAATGNADALNLLGVLYRHGEGIEADPERAVGFFEQSAAQGYSPALYNLGDLLQDGAPGVPVDLSRAEQLYLRAIAVDNNAGAMNNLAVLLETRDAIPDWTRIFVLYQDAIARGDRDAPVNLALILFHGDAGHEDPVEARRLLQEEVAETGYGRAERLLGYFNEIGSGGPQDTGRAIALYQAAMADGYPDAAVDLGVLYRFGAPGLAPDLRQAADWFRRGSGMGSGDAANELGLLFVDGDPSVLDDITQANTFFRLAHERGLDHGSRNLAISYWHGDGVAEDHAEARRLMEIAARDRLPDAVNDLGVMQDEGVGGPVDARAARALFREAAKAGLALAGLNLSGSLMRAGAPGADPLEGLAWCYWAVARTEDAAGRDEYEETCAARSDGWPQGKRDQSLARSQQLLARF